MDGQKRCTYIHPRHNLRSLLIIQTQHPIQNSNLIVPQRFLPFTVELKEGLEFGFAEAV